MGNTGYNFEQYIFEKVKEKCDQYNNITPHLHKKYYSLDRQDYIIPDVTIEKIINGQLFFVIVIECKDYEGNISVSEIEEFHSKLQQIGADNTKGVMVTRNGKFQKSALNYAKAKGISLAICKKDISLVDFDSRGKMCKKHRSPITLILTFPLLIIGLIIEGVFLLISFIKYYYNKKYSAKYDFDKIIDYYING